MIIYKIHQHKIEILYDYLECGQWYINLNFQRVDKNPNHCSNICVPINYEGVSKNKVPYFFSRIGFILSTKIVCTQINTHTKVLVAAIVQARIL